MTKDAKTQQNANNTSIVSKGKFIAAINTIRQYKGARLCRTPKLLINEVIDIWKK